MALPRVFFKSESANGGAASGGKMSEKRTSRIVKFFKENAEDGAPRVFYLFILSSFIFALTVIPVRVIFDEAFRQSAGYRLILFQLTAGVVFLRLPRLLARPLGIELPSGLYIAYMLFLWGAIFLGEFALLYYRAAMWDTVMHIYSAVLLSFLGLSLPRLFTGEEISPALTAMLSLGFSLLIGVLWEIYEFSFDGLLGLNMQKFAAPIGIGKGLSPLVGREALIDTMTDLIVDLAASAAVSVWAYLYIKRKGALPKCLTVNRTEK